MSTRRAQDVPGRMKVEARPSPFDSNQQRRHLEELEKSQKSTPGMNETPMLGDMSAAMEEKLFSVFDTLSVCGSLINDLRLFFFGLFDSVFLLTFWRTAAGMDDDSVAIAQSTEDLFLPYLIGVFVSDGRASGGVSSIYPLIPSGRVYLRLQISSFDVASCKFVKLHMYRLGRIPGQHTHQIRDCSRCSHGCKSPIKFYCP